MKKKLFTLLFALTAMVLAAQAQNANDGHEYVDLGLPSGTLWATCNVGATKPDEYGLYFAWGETKGYTNDTNDGHSFDRANYKWFNGSYNSQTKYNYDSSYGTVDNKIELDLEDDAAYVNWGSQWCMPSKAQQDELRENCIWTWTTLNGANGYMVMSKINDNSIFLPAAGHRRDASHFDVGFDGYYWSRSFSYNISYHAYYLFFDTRFTDWSNHNRLRGYSVRPVRR